MPFAAAAAAAAVAAAAVWVEQQQQESAAAAQLRKLSSLIEVFVCLFCSHTEQNKKIKIYLFLSLHFTFVYI